MADNITLPGSGAVVLSDDCTTGQAQIVKLAISTDGSATLIPADATNGIDVDVTRVTGNVTIVGTGTLAVQVDGSALTSLQLIDDAIHADDAARGKSLLMGAVLDDSSPTTITENQGGYLRMSSRRALLVEGVASGTAVSVTEGSAASALTALQLIDDPVYADDAGFTVGSGKVMMVGANAVAHGANPDAADANDAVVCITNRHRVPFVIGGHPNIITATLNITTAITDTSLVGTIATGTKVVCTGFQFTVDNASTVFPKILIGFGTTNTPTTTGVIGAHGGVPAGGGFGRGDGTGMLGVGGDGEELRVTTVGTIGGNGGYLTYSYYLIES